ncbi:hypothetical protein LEP1GSC051_2285 [Leptospira sp. P2653]|nr:hypothetical protein LEP1GSC051_2285 [Leptospira sp. P2653]
MYFGLEIKEEEYPSTGFKRDFIHVDLYFPDKIDPIPIHCYIPERAVNRNRFHIICNYLNLDIKEFESDCKM